MAVEVNVAAAFGAQLQDNSNTIPLPSGGTWNWSTDDDTDQISILSQDTSVASVTCVNGPPNRTSVTVTASTTAPDGSTVSGSVTTDIVGGVTHVYSVIVAQETAVAPAVHHKKK